MLDPKKNFAVASLSDTLSAGATVMQIEAGQVDRLPSTAGYNGVIWNFADYANPGDDANHEIVRITAIDGQAFTIERGQEDTSDVAHEDTGAEYKILVGWTKKDVDDLNLVIPTGEEKSRIGNLPEDTVAELALKAEEALEFIEYPDLASFPPTGEEGYIYVALDTGVSYRWSGTAYTARSSGVVLGETSTTAYRGDRGKEAYDHMSDEDNPHSVDKSDVGLSDVDNTADMDKPISDLTQAELDSKQNIGGSGITTVTIEPVDDWQSQCLVESKAGLDFFGMERVLISEFATPNECKNNTNSEQDEWNALAKILYDYYNSRGVDVAWWAFGHEGGDVYQCNVWAKNDTTDIWEDKATAEIYAEIIQKASKVYHNYAGNEFYVDSGSPPAWGSGLPDSAPTEADFQLYADKGVDVIRYPIGEPASGGEWLGHETTGINPIFIGHIERVLNRAQAVGIEIQLDVLHPGDGNAYGSIFGNSLKNTTGMDLYKQYVLALGNHSFTDNNGATTTVKEHPALDGVETINEPHSGGIGDFTASDTESVTQEIATYWQDTVGLPTSKTIYTPSHQWSGLQSVTTHHTSPWITGITNHCYVPHFYPLPEHNDHWVNLADPDKDEYIEDTYADAVAGASEFAGQGSYEIILSGGSLSDEAYAAAVKRVIPMATQAEIEVGALHDSRFVSPRNLNNAINNIITGDGESAAIAITNDVSGDNGFITDGGASSDSLTLPDIDTSNADYLIVRVACRQVDDITSVTFDGEAMVLLGRALNPSEGCGVDTYGLADPTKTTGDVVVDLSTNHFLSIQAVALKNVGDVQSIFTAEAWGTEAQVTVTAPQDNCMVILGLEETNNVSVAPMDGQTTIHNSDHPSENAGREDTSYVMVDTGDTAVGYTLGEGNNWAIVAVVLTPKVIEADLEDIPMTGNEALQIDGTEVLSIEDKPEYSVDTTGELSFYLEFVVDKLDFDKVEASSDLYTNFVGKMQISPTREVEWLFRRSNTNSPKPGRLSFYIFEADGGLGSGAWIEMPEEVGEVIKIGVTVIHDENLSNKGDIWIYDARYEGGSLTEFNRSNGLIDSDDCLGAHQDLDHYPDVPTNMGNTSAPTVFGHIDDSSGQNCTSHIKLLRFGIWNRVLDYQTEIKNKLFRRTIPGNGIVDFFEFRQSQHAQDGTTDETKIVSIAGLESQIVGDSAFKFTSNLISKPQYNYIGSVDATGSNETLQSANRSWFREFEIGNDMTITEVSLVIYTSAGNIDVGIYSEAGKLIGSIGSTACPAVGVATIALQEEIKLGRGKYYLAVVGDDATTAIRTSSTYLLAGGFRKDSNFPLADLAGAVVDETAINNRAFALIAK